MLFVILAIVTCPPLLDSKLEDLVRLSNTSIEVGLLLINGWVKVGDGGLH